MKDDTLYLIHISECMDKIDLYMAGVDRERFFKSILIQDAVLRNLQVLAESTQRLTDEFKEANPDVEWLRLQGCGIYWCMTIWVLISRQCGIL